MAEQLVENKDTETKDDTKNEAEKEIKKETKPKKSYGFTIKTKMKFVLT